MIIHNETINIVIDKVCEGKYNIVNNDSKEIINSIYTKTDESAITSFEKEYRVQSRAWYLRD